MKDIVPFIGVPCFIIAVVCFVIAFKNKTNKEKFKKFLIGGTVFITITVVLAVLFPTPKIESLKIKNDITVYADESKDLGLVVNPNDASDNEVQCNYVEDKDSKYFKIDGLKIKGIKEGEGTVICSFTGEEKTINSNKATITVKLTEKQIAAKNKDAEEKAKKEAEKLQKEQEKNQKDAQAKAEEAERNKNILSSSEQSFAKDYAKQYVEKILKAPSTAEFPGGWLDPYENWGMSKLNNLVTVASYVDSENSFGAMIRSSFRIQMQINGETWSVTYFEFDGEVLQGTYQ